MVYLNDTLIGCNRAVGNHLRKEVMPVVEAKDVFLILFSFGSFLIMLLTYLKKK